MALFLLEDRDFKGFRMNIWNAGVSVITRSTFCSLFSSPVGQINLIVILFFRDNAQTKGTSVRQMKETSARRELIPEKQSRTTEVHAINNSPGNPVTTDHVHSITANIGDTVCIARSSTSCDFGVVTSRWKTKVNITYLKKNGNNLLSVWKLQGDKMYEDSVHLNSIFYSLGKSIMSVTNGDMKDIKAKLKTLF